MSTLDALSDEDLRDRERRLLDELDAVREAKLLRIRVARMTGARPTDIARFWGLTRARIYQITDADFHPVADD